MVLLVLGGAVKKTTTSGPIAKALMTATTVTVAVPIVMTKTVQPFLLESAA